MIQHSLRHALLMAITVSLALGGIAQISAAAR